MGNAPFISYKIDDRSHVPYIKREIHNLLSQAEFSSMRAGEIDIVISELTSNLIKHADGGELIYRLNEFPEDNKSFEVYCVDKGPGTNSMDRMMKDGISSANTLGHGLGAISRLSDIFQIYSVKGWGTLAYSKCWMIKEERQARAKASLEISALQVCIPGEKVCGDGYHIKKTESETQIFVGDGLGHGIHAHEAVSMAIEGFKSGSETEPDQILRHLHAYTKKTRGLVGTVAILNHKTNHWRICGIGNISTRLFSGLHLKTYMSYNGIIGHNIPRTLTNFNSEGEIYNGIVMCSDGIKSRWDFLKYPSILKYTGAVVAGAIFMDYARRTDDMSILIGRISG